MSGSSVCDEGVVPVEGEGTIAYQVHGCGHTGTPVLLIRPVGGSMDLWGAFRERIAREFRVISFDLRGSGRSTPDPRWSTTQNLATDCLRVLDHIHVPLTHVFGLSLGGMIGTWLTIMAPARVAHLCLASTPERGLELAHAGLRRHFALAACFASRDAEVETDLIQHVLSLRFRATHPARVLEIRDLIRANPASRAALLKHLFAALRHDARGELQRIERPTLVLSGEYDELLGHGPPHALAAAIADSRFEIIADSGHDLSLEQPLVAADRVCEFFR